MMIIFLFINFLWGILFANENSSIDLETLSQDFVLNTKKIEIPGHAFAFNPSLVRWQGQLLLSFRIIPDPKQKYNSELGLVFLNEELEPMNSPQLLNLREEGSMAPCRAEDARLLVLGNRLFMIYDDNLELKISKGGFRMYVAELHYDGEHFAVDSIECLKHYEGASDNIREKSWVPFIYQNQILLAYSISPHKIFHPRLDGSESCDTIASTQGSFFWDFGTLRGGTPALLEHDQYLAFFHSSKEMTTTHSEGEKILHYFMGAYTFAKDPPFEITSISPQPIIGKHFYNGTNYKPYWKPLRCIFPCGYIADDQFIWIAYGRDDHECWITKLDKLKLLNSLIPVANISSHTHLRCTP